MELLISIILLITGYLTGRSFEVRHYKRIRLREKKFHHIPIITSRWQECIEEDEEGILFTGGVVISSDYFKTFISALRMFFGGRIREYETLLDRGRREAILRMKEKAARWGAEKIINMRLEHSSIYGGNMQKGGFALPAVEVFAYATAIKKKSSH